MTGPGEHTSPPRSEDPEAGFDDRDCYTPMRVLSEGRPLPLEVFRAEGSAARRKGLLERDALAEGFGLFLPWCPSIHMVGMRFDIDAVFFSPSGKVIRVCRAVPRGFHFRHSLRGLNCLELASGEALRLSIEKGQRLIFEAI